MDSQLGRFAWLASIIGMEAAEKLSRAMGGLPVYIPKPDSLDRIRRDAKIIAEFNGTNAAHLAIKYKQSERNILRIIARARNNTRALSVDDILAQYDDNEKGS